jgi:hypothetical protein
MNVTDEALASEIPNGNVALTKREEQLVLVKEDEGRRSHEVGA